jgi:hypothetical protein
MRKALLSTTVAVCGILGATLSGSAQAGRVAVSVNIVAPLTPGVVVGSGYYGYGGAPVVAQPVFVVPQRAVVVAPVVVVPVVRFGNHGYRHNHYYRNDYRNDYRGRGGYGYRY